MPWMPELFSAPIAEATRVSGKDAVPYYEGIKSGELQALEDSFAAGHPVIDDPQAGRREGSAFFSYVRDVAGWLHEWGGEVEDVALTLTPTRMVEEVVLHATSFRGGGKIELPVAIVTERNPDRTVKSVRVYHSVRPILGEHIVRPPLLPEDPTLRAEDPPGEYQRALAEGDLAGIVATFESEGYAREPRGAAYLHRGPEGLKEFYSHLLTNGGIALESCAITDDKVRCAVEYNCVRWGVTDIPPQAGVAVYERGSSGLLSAVRIYDDVEFPTASDTSLG